MRSAFAAPLVLAALPLAAETTASPPAPAPESFAHGLAARIRL